VKGLQSHLADMVRQSPTERLVKKTHNSVSFQEDLVSYYTKHHIQCHMVFNVNMVNFQMTLLMNMRTNTVMDGG